ncbi:5-formyltetrahydrofolate cyclo-ligase [Pedobacter sp. BAL39]|uniref:5-formyltetrahydrofolate cyclo-ligase n=1 Tax=Pedobacter sp. BAL39 TaxID=391596 RepID=UPI0001559AFF|nr:5-formyltetrahydrofolate cyclo-ligase [Pedobacter sp. BAL39]EDM36362.1 5-formyltetrahydrofolate cyclo-ligase [Pedobacter sp. BAL39]
MKKSEIRKEIMVRRTALSKAEMVEINASLLRQFSILDFTEINSIHIFLPIVEKNEPDTFLMIDWLKAHQPQIKIIVPKADFDTALMTNHHYEGKEDLQENLYKILEPQKGALHTGDVDMVIIPLLAFDMSGNRVGYGKGFYDRFLQPMGTRKIGLSLFSELTVIDDVNVHDVKLDECLTPEKRYVFPVVFK